LKKRRTLRLLKEMKIEENFMKNQDWGYGFSGKALGSRP
jgi:hypothetical protein